MREEGEGERGNKEGAGDALVMLNLTITTYRQVNMHSRPLFFSSVAVHTHTNPYMHTCTRARTHTHTHARSLSHTHTHCKRTSAPSKTMTRRHFTRATTAIREKRQAITRSCAFSAIVSGMAYGGEGVEQMTLAGKERTEWPSPNAHELAVGRTLQNALDKTSSKVSASGNGRFW